MGIVENYRCSACGHEFVRIEGGFVLDIRSIFIRKCPQCGSRKIIRTKKS